LPLVKMSRSGSYWQPLQPSGVSYPL